VEARPDRFRLGPEAEGGKCARLLALGGICAPKGLAALGSRALQGPVIESVRIARVHGVPPPGESPAILRKLVVLSIVHLFYLWNDRVFLPASAVANAVSIVAGLNL
jgi:hypothetical protein